MRRLAPLAALALISALALPSRALAQTDADPVDPPLATVRAPVALDAPIIVGVLDATKTARDSASIRKTLNAWLDKRDGVTPTDASALSEAVQKTLRSEDGATTRAKLLKDNKLDALLVFSAQGGGRRLVAVVFGPDGALLGNDNKKLRRRRKVRASTLNDLLATPLDKATTAVRARRKAAQQARAAARADQLKRAEAARSKAEADKQAAQAARSRADDRKAQADLDRAAPEVLPGLATVEVGALLAQRGVAFSSEAVRVNTTTPFLGAAATLDVGLQAGDSGRVGLILRGAWGAGSVASTDDQLDPITLTSRLARAGATLSYTHALQENIALGLGLRADLASATIEANPRYTGHRYLTAAPELRLAALLGPARLTLAGGPLATLSATTSGDAYGQGARTLLSGYTAHAHLALLLTDLLGLSLSYEIQDLKPTYDRATTSSHEILHWGQLAASVSF